MRTKIICMIIPESITDQGAFYRQCKAKGIKVQSRFPHVYVEAKKNRLMWAAKVKKQHGSVRPFTPDGERQAYQDALDIKNGTFKAKPIGVSRSRGIILS